MSSDSLISLEDAKIYLNITHNNDNTLILTLSDAISRLVESFCGRVFKAADYVEYHDGDNNVELFTDQWPINSVASIYDDVNRNYTSVHLIDPTYYVYYAEEGRIALTTVSFVGMASPVFARGFQNIKISYNAGYSTIPTDLTMIAGEILVKKFKNVVDHRVGMMNVSATGEGFGLSLNDILPEHRLILNAKYKRRGIK